jgi:hypothetical protein
MVISSTPPRRAPFSLRTLLGVPFGAFVFATDYAVLPLGGFYKPIWEYDLKTLWDDLSAHLVFGTATAATFALLAGRPLKTG